MAFQPVQFVKEARVELSKVTWLTRQQAIRYSILVIVVSIVVAAFLGTLDYFFGALIDQFIL